MKKPVIFFALLFAASGCKNDAKSLLRSLDSLIFKSAGVSLISKPSSLSIKELRLSGNNLETEVIVEGQVEEVSDNSTYFVISDKSARLLVVTTELTPRISDVVFKKGKGAEVKVIGRVEIGKKGLPFLKATAITASGTSSGDGSKS